MPHCSSEHDEQFGSMVGGAALERALTVPVATGGPMDDTKRTHNNGNLDKVVPDKKFMDILEKIRSFQTEFGSGLQGFGDASLCIYTNKGKWVSLDDFNTGYRDPADQVDETELRNAIKDIENKIGLKISIEIQNVIASIILDSPKQISLMPAQTSQKCAIITRASVAALDITTSIVAKLLEHFKLEQLQGLLKNMVDKWKASVNIVIDKLAELEMSKLFVGTTQNIIQISTREFMPIRL